MWCIFSVNINFLKLFGGLMNKKTFFKLTTLLTSFLLVSFLSYAFKKEINVSNPLNKHMKKILISGSSITQTLCENLSESFLKNNPKSSTWWDILKKNGSTRRTSKINFITRFPKNSFVLYNFHTLSIFVEILQLYLFQ